MLSAWLYSIKKVSGVIAPSSTRCST